MEESERTANRKRAIESGTKGRKKGLEGRRGYGVEISMDSRLRRPPALNTKKSHFSATNFKTCYMLIFNYLLVSITL